MVWNVQVYENDRKTNYTPCDRHVLIYHEGMWEEEEDPSQWEEEIEIRSVREEDKSMASNNLFVYVL